ncbi:MAG TPA: hypothetical protein VE130_09635 [Nitrososphaeraceae archaeon]|nr:hypothetical protein [Nitrososphaeraceae archaeon]
MKQVSSIVRKSIALHEYSTMFLLLFEIGMDVLRPIVAASEGVHPV